jgi:hypothetical protein
MLLAVETGPNGVSGSGSKTFGAAAAAGLAPGLLKLRAWPNSPERASSRSDV